MEGELVEKARKEDPGSWDSTMCPVHGAPGQPLTLSGEVHPYGRAQEEADPRSRRNHRSKDSRHRKQTSRAYSKTTNALFGSRSLACGHSQAVP